MKLEENVYVILKNKLRDSKNKSMQFNFISATFTTLAGANLATMQMQSLTVYWCKSQLCYKCIS